MLLGLLCFCVIVWWAFSSVTRKRFEEAERIPFDEEDGNTP